MTKIKRTMLLIGIVLFAIACNKQPPLTNYTYNVPVVFPDPTDSVRIKITSVSLDPTSVNNLVCQFQIFDTSGISTPEHYNEINIGMIDTYFTSYSTEVMLDSTIKFEEGNMYGKRLTGSNVGFYGSVIGGVPQLTSGSIRMEIYFNGISVYDSISNPLNVALEFY